MCRKRMRKQKSILVLKIGFIRIEPTVAEFIKTVEGEDIKISTEEFVDITDEKEVEGIGPQHFVMISMLGKGATGRVVLVQCTINNKVYAMKV